MRRLAAVLCGLLLLCSCRTALESPRPADSATVSARGRLELFLDSAEPGATELSLPQSGLRLAVGAHPVLTAEDFDRVDVAPLELGRALRLRPNARGAQALRHIGADAVGRRLVLVVDGRALAMKRVESGFNEPSLVLFAEVADAELTILAERLNSAMAAVKNR